MQRKDRPFVLYRRGPMSFTIVPRGIMGWTQFIVWLALAAPLLAWFVEHATTPAFARANVLEDVIFLFVIGIAVWLIAGVWWMRAHAEEVDVVVYRRDQQRARRRRERDG
jgi:hypothetical protein